MSDSKSRDSALAANAKPEEEVVETKTPTKRTPKRKADAFQKESEELLKNLGVTVDMDDGRRRTRSSARVGTETPTTTPVTTTPVKRARGASNTPKRGKQEEEEPEEETQSTAKVTARKRGLATPRKLVDVNEHEPKKDEDSGADSTDNCLEKKESKEMKEDAAAVTSAEAAVEEETADVQETTENKLEKSEKATAGKAVVGKSSVKKGAVKPDDATQEEPTAKKEKEDTELESVGGTEPVEEPMEVDEQDAKSSVPTETPAPDKPAKETVGVTPAEQLPKVVDGTPEDVKETNAEAAESNGNNDSSVEQQKSEKEAVSEGKETTVVEAGVKTDSLPTSNDKVETVENTTQDSDKTVSAVEVNNVAQKTCANVESKIVSNDSAAVQPATTAP